MRVLFYFLYPHFPDFLVVYLLPLQVPLRRPNHSQVVDFVLELKLLLEKLNLALVPLNFLLKFINILFLRLVRKNSWPHRHLVKFFTVVFRAAVRLTDGLQVGYVFYGDS